MRASHSSRHPRQPRGVALVIVLAFIVILSTLIVAFLSSVRTEVQSAKSYESGVTVKQLVSSATNLVTGQITEATRSTKTARPPGNLTPIPKGERLTWASQPGMIRAWDDTGNGWKVFKLYSSANMVSDFKPDGTFSTESDRKAELPEDWPNKPALFTDLNQPVLVRDDSGMIARDGEKYRASYPIMDPLAMLKINNVERVDGFRIATPPGYGGAVSEDADKIKVVAMKESDDPTRDVGAGKTANPAAMPVSWIYVLKDGTLTVPTRADPEDPATAVWSGSAAEFTPSRDNPIVGRVAFWADDETCKLNVNTSSEPTPWDTPRAVTISDLNYGKFQPAMQEYQRFPGHPFMTALSPVLMPQVKLTPQQKIAIYDLLPRIEKGGSNAAQVVTGSATKVTLDEDRLFANVDEFLFGVPSTDPRKALSEDSRASILKLDINRLRRARFFLTANSRAPEVNHFGQPRVSLWPVHETATSRTAFDKLAAFCTTLGDSTKPASLRRFYFQRKSSTSPTVDYTIPRNPELYGYLQRLTDMEVPGYGASFASKWMADRDQILTQVFDYIRCVNIHDTTRTPPPANSLVQYAGDNSPGGANAGEGQVAPIKIVTKQGTTKGFGRFHSIQGFGFHFICSRNDKEGAGAAPNPALKPNERLVEAAFLFEPFSPSLGWYEMGEDMTFDVKFGSFSLDGQPLNMRSGAKQLRDNIGSGWHNNGRERGGSGGLRGPVQGFGGGGYHFIGTSRVKVGADGKQKMTFSGGTIEVKVYVGGTVSTANEIQTFNLNFPGGDFPLPDLVTEGTLAYNGDCPTTTKDYWWTFANRYSRVGTVPHAPGAEYADPTRRWTNHGGPAGFKPGGLFRREDVVRAIVPSHGDMRLIAALPVVGPEQFVKVSPLHWGSDYRFLHIFSNASGNHFHYGFCNEPGPSPSTNPKDIPPAALEDQLVPSKDVKYHYSRLPQIRPGAGKFFNAWNDFDNGSAQWVDGAYINKPDEGNQSKTNSIGGNEYPYFAWNFEEPSETYFSPNRLVPSAGMLGSLPTGVKRHINPLDPASPKSDEAVSFHAWETLLFRPEVRKNILGERHPGTKNPPDHVFMDLFWMPVIEPYAISEPFSTAGKINLNYEIAPFNYIRRATALHGLMKGEEPLLIPNEASKLVKLWDHETNDNGIMPDDARSQDPQVRADWAKLARGQAPFDKLRRPIDVEKTLKQAEDRFAAGKLFSSATEICEIHLVREGELLRDYEAPGNIWNRHLMTGDNTRERPYTNLYARLTTRSNSYTVHVRAQVLRQAGGPDAADWLKWREGRDQQLSEYRGSTLVERYIDPADPVFSNTNAKPADVDFALNPNLTIDSAYKIRVISTRKFTP
jgi:uncharacterized protein (TIGR02600 family)